MDERDIERERWGRDRVKKMGERDGENGGGKRERGSMSDLQGA